MKIIYNNIIPFKGFTAINLFGALLVRKDVAITERMIRHETIHTKQMQELLFVPFYILYLLEWLVKFCFYVKQAHCNISFEREAYKNDWEIGYVKKRKRFAFLHHL